MVRCRILVKGPYSDYQGSGTNRKAVVHSEGQIISFPLYYAVRLRDMKMVEILDDVGAPEVIEIDEPDQVQHLRLVLETDPPDPPDATESAIEFAADNQIDLTQVEGTLPEGRISLVDVRNYQLDHAG